MYLYHGRGRNFAEHREAIQADRTQISAAAVTASPATWKSGITAAEAIAHRVGFGLTAGMPPTT
jgi:hypothetical protein